MVILMKNVFAKRLSKESDTTEISRKTIASKQIFWPGDFLSNFNLFGMWFLRASPLRISKVNLTIKINLIRFTLFDVICFLHRYFTPLTSAPAYPAPNPDGLQASFLPPFPPYLELRILLCAFHSFKPSHRPVVRLFRLRSIHFLISSSLPGFRSDLFAILYTFVWMLSWVLFRRFVLIFSDAFLL